MESKLIRMEEKARFLAKRYWIKIYNCDNKELGVIMKRLEILEYRLNLQSKRKKNILIESQIDLKI